MKELVDYFIKETDKKFDRLEEKVDDRFKTLDGKMDTILRTKYKIVGGTVAASLILTGLFQVIAFLNKG